MKSEVALIPNITYEMLSVNYWLDRVTDMNRVLMDESQIDEFNGRNRIEVAQEARLYDLTVFGDCIDGDDLRSIVSETSFPDTIWFCSGQEVTPDYWESIRRNRNLCNIKGKNKVRYGICASRTDIRLFPTTDSLNETAKDIDTDQLQSSAMLINEPVVILYESADEKWYFVRSCYYDGWVLKEGIALCKNYETWFKNSYIQDFLVITANRLLLSYDPIRSNVSLLEVTMGTKFAIDREVDHAYYNYPVKIPVKDNEGYLQYEVVNIPVSSDVSIGYLKYTTKNVLTLAFKTLGDKYGWGGAMDTRDCSSLPFELFRCFGFSLPRDSSSFGKIVDCISYTNFSYATVTDRKDILRQVRPGAIIGWPGHTMIYIGTVDGNYYVINFAGHFSCRQGNGLMKRYQVDICLVNDLMVLRNNGLSWLESLTYVKSLE